MAVLRTAAVRNARPRSLGASGFTLIELLVVIAIIAILASVILASLGQARSKSRDARRLADLKEYASALELYVNDNGHYPVQSAAGALPVLGPQYISATPSEQFPSWQAYQYISADGSHYCVGARFEGSLPAATPTCPTSEAGNQLPLGTTNPGQVNYVMGQ